MILLITTTPKINTIGVGKDGEICMNTMNINIVFFLPKFWSCTVINRFGKCNFGTNLAISGDLEHISWQQRYSPSLGMDIRSAF